MTTKTDITLPEPAFKLRWHDDTARYTVSVPNIGDTDCYTADQVRAAVEADRKRQGDSAKVLAELVALIPLADTLNASASCQDLIDYFKGVIADRKRRGEPVPKGWKLVPETPTSKQIVHMACQIKGADADGWFRTDGDDWPEHVDAAERAYKWALSEAPQPAKPVKVPSEEEIEALAFEYCDETGAGGDCPRFIGTQSITRLIRALLSRYGNGQPATPPDASKELTDLVARLRALSRYEHDDMSVADEAADLLMSGQPAASAKPNTHTDDDAVDRFAAAMKAKLAQKRAEGRGGWETCSAEYLSGLLREHVEKGDPLDVANLAMMLHQNGQRVAAQAQAVVNKQLTTEPSAQDFDDCAASPTGKHSKSWFANGDCEYCKTGAQPNAPLFYAHAQPSAQDREDAGDPLQGAANWLLEVIENCRPVDLQNRLFIGYNRASRLIDAARAAKEQS